MSYILDALKKSEQERGHGHIPSVQTVHTSSLNYSDKKTWWPYILITAVALNLAAIIYFYLNKNEMPVATTASMASSTVNNRESVPSGSNATAPVVTSALHENTNNSPRQPIAASAVIAPAANNATTTNTGSTRQVPVQPASITNSEVVDTYSQPAASDNYSAQNYNTQPREEESTNAESNDTEIIDYYDLPEATKRRLPSIVVSAHVYSDNPLQRSIVINNNFLEEGERILDDLILQEITPDGAIMNYRGIVFRYEVISGWQ